MPASPAQTTSQHSESSFSSDTYSDQWTVSMLYPEKSMVNMMESSLAESMVNSANNMYDPMVSMF